MKKTPRSHPVRPAVAIQRAAKRIRRQCVPIHPIPANATDEPRALMLTKSIVAIQARQVEIHDSMREHESAMRALNAERTRLLTENETAAKELANLVSVEAYERIIKARD